MSAPGLCQMGPGVFLKKILQGGKLELAQITGSKYVLTINNITFFK